MMLTRQKEAAVSEIMIIIINNAVNLFIFSSMFISYFKKSPALLLLSVRQV